MKRHVRLDSLLSHMRKAADERMIGAEATHNCITAAKVLCNSIRTVLGPMGMYKMLSEEARPLLISRDGYSIITGLLVEHPSARLIVELAKAHNDEVGDGVTSTLVLAGSLLEKASQLINAGLHPILIFEGYREAMEVAIEIMEQFSVPIEHENDMLYKVAKTVLKGEGDERMCYDIVKAVRMTKKSGEKLDTDMIRIREVEGDWFEDTRMVEGTVLYNWVTPGSPERMERAKIAILREPLMVKRAKNIFDVNIRPSDLPYLFKKEDELLRKKVDKLKSVGANVVVCKDMIDRRARGMLVKEDVMCIEGVAKYEDLRHLPLATGGKIVKNIEDIKEEDLGYAEVVEWKKIAEEDVVFFEGCENTKASTFFVRGGTKEVVKEHKNIIYDAIRAASNTIDVPFVLPGGGAIETELAMRLRKVATEEKTKKQISMLFFSEALESIPKTLAYNAGLNPLDAIAELRARHQKDPYVGICIKMEGGEGEEGEEEIKVTMENNFEAGIIEPLGIRKQVLIGAIEVTELILLTDGILSDRERMKKVKEEERRKNLGIKEDKEEEEEEEIFPEAGVVRR